MGKSQKPLTIYVPREWSSLPWVNALEIKGHTIGLLDAGLDHADLILGPTCARFIPGMEKFLDSFIKGARAIKYKGEKSG